MSAILEKMDITTKVNELHQEQGLLEVTGELDLEQFWPGGTSDADTANISLDLSAAPFEFRQTLKAQPKATHAFDNAWVHGRGKPQPAIRGQNENKPHVTVRFQGIDAPELHFQPTERGTKDFRQILGETCALKLRQDIQEAAPSGKISCRIVTAVNHPGDAFDTFGRLVGDILIEQHGQTINLNHWLVENGWAFPTFYDSMSIKEIEAYEVLVHKARQNKSGVYAHLTGEIKDLDWNLLFRRNGAIEKEPAGKNTLMPKIFRRLATWSVMKKNGSTEDSFIAFVTHLPKDQKQCLLLSDFKRGPSVRRTLDQFIVPNIVNGLFDKNPEDLVFVESLSKLFDQEQGGQEIKKWW